MPERIPPLPESDAEDALRLSQQVAMRGEGQKYAPISPNHYSGNKVETIEYIRGLQGSMSPYEGFCVGNVIKYVSRFKEKGTPVEDLRKAARYLEWLIEAQT